MDEDEDESCQIEELRDVAALIFLQTALEDVADLETRYSPSRMLDRMSHLHASVESMAQQDWLEASVVCGFCSSFAKFIAGTFPCLN